MAIYPANTINSAVEDPHLSRAVSAEKEANRRIKAAYAEVQRAETDADIALHQIQDTYEKRTTAEEERQRIELESNH